MVDQKILTELLLFKNLSPEEQETVAAAGEVVFKNAGDYIYESGTEGDFFYVILQGEVELIARRDDNSSCMVGRIGEGGHFGESALLTSQPRSLSLRAVSDVRLAKFSKDFFREKLLPNPLFHEELDKALVERLRFALHDQLETAFNQRPYFVQVENTDLYPLFETSESVTELEELTPRTLKNVQEGIKKFAQDLEPMVVIGESGTGRKGATRQIHKLSKYRKGPYGVVDLRKFEPLILEGKLYGHEPGSLAFSHLREAGIFEQFRGGTLVLYHVEVLEEDIKQKLLQTIHDGYYYRVGGQTRLNLGARLIFICAARQNTGSNPCRFIDGLPGLFADRVLSLPPLREHKRDIPPLVDHYLYHFNKEYNRKVKGFEKSVLGLLMNYEWPGNMTELRNVIQRAVLLAEQDEILSEQILLGLPQPEGKLEHNLLRWPFIGAIFRSRLFPQLPRILIAIIFFLGLLTLFFGPQNDPAKNIGLIMSWSIGWPLMLFSFFFLGRIWCSVCSLSLPGNLMQKIIRPKHNVPQFIKDHSSWIMAVFCIIIFWIELVWDAYHDTRLTGFIILGITSGSLLFSVLFKRRAWCRYVCPLGALNAIFAMPSIMELRANRQLCVNTCRSRLCYQGDMEHEGCPMFRHPFMVDNNRDCTLCGNCIKNCPHDSIQLNLRIAPLELWNIQAPRLADSFLVVALSALFFPMLKHQEFLALVSKYNMPHLTGSLILFCLIALFMAIYSLFCRQQARISGIGFAHIFAATGYGYIPLVLGGFLAIYFEMFMAGAWHVFPLALSVFGLEAPETGYRLLSREVTLTLQHLIITGGLLASLYATYRVVKRYTMTERFSLKLYGLPYGFLLVSGLLFLFAL
ncbi:MAG: sigma 54-interacting transcriptional regulator [Proteobacteria bacterium]|nr:sigma 54-interacting transcriptional regulator [Pseudomonadota bacterium]MBU1716682.1 sigma 54-interacting transcriptional regulator [Pseudomonadota bacterium]